MRAWVRMSAALLAFTCLLGCAAPVGTIALTKPTLAVSRMLSYQRGCNEGARALFRRLGDTPSVQFTPWGVVWLEDEGLFAAGRYLDEPEIVAEAGTPIPPEWVEVRLTKAEALEYFRLLLDGHTALAVAKAMGYPSTRMISVRGLCQDQVYWFPHWVENRRVLGREFVKVLAEAMEGSRVKKPNLRFSEAGRHVVEELGELPLEKWPEWYRQNGRRLEWDPTTDKHKVQRELR